MAVTRCQRVGAFVEGVSALPARLPNPSRAMGLPSGSTCSRLSAAGCCNAGACQCPGARAFLLEIINEKAFTKSQESSAPNRAMG